MRTDPRSRRVRLALAFALAFASALVVVSGSASAHAVYESGTPPAGGRAPLGTVFVEVRFSEDVLREYTALDVLDLEGASWANGPTQFDDDAANVARVPVKPLTDGVYTVSWRALSVDAHTTRGSYVFAVGNATLEFAPMVESSDPAADPLDEVVADGAARAATYLGLFAALGAPFFALVVDRERDVPRRLLAASGALALVGALGGVAMLLLFAQRTLLGLQAAMATVAGATIAWRAILLAGAGAFLVVAAFAPGRARRNLAVLGVLAAAAALVAIAMGSHASASTDQRLVALGMDAAHLLMGSIWVGGVLAFLLVAWDRPATEIGRLVARFTPIAISSVIVLLATGTYASLRHIPTIPDLWEERYGRLVLIKLALLGPLVLLVWYGKNRLAPRLLAGDASQPGAFRRALRAEAIVMALVIAAAGVLAASAPPEREIAQGDAGPSLAGAAQPEAKSPGVLAPMRFASASGGFNYDDAPILHVHATQPAPGLVPEPKESPAPPALALVTLALALALALPRRW